MSAATDPDETPSPERETEPSVDHGAPEPRGDGDAPESFAGETVAAEANVTESVDVDEPAAKIAPPSDDLHSVDPLPEPRGDKDDDDDGVRPPFATAKPKLRDAILVGIGAVGLGALMFHRGHLRGAVPIGFILTVLMVLGLLGLIGDSPFDLRGDETTDRPEEETLPWYRRGSTLVLLFSGALYLPRAGAYGLWDPWETHYSEVAREILSRDDWITLWWGQEGWFMSKPILIFWMSAMGMGFGTSFGLDIHADAGPQWQEWCIRVPISLLAMAALWALYRAVSSAWGKRAGVLVAFVLATMPHWFFLAHQAMTDMPFVAPLTIAMSMLMLAITAGNRRAIARLIDLKALRLRWSLWHSAIGTFLLFSIPQIAYLLTRPLVVACPDDSRVAQCTEMLRANRIGSFQFPVETYFYGSFGNSADTLANSVPGSPAWERLANVVPFFPSVVQGLVWLALGTLSIAIMRRERTQRDLYFLLFYVWCAVSTMGKGPAGLVIPIAVAGVWLITSGRWKLLPHARLGAGLAAFFVVAMPWYVAILCRLGNEFFDRFVVHDLINRTLVGVHGDTGTIQYFIWQLGYAMFPWVGLVPVALLGWRQIVSRQATEAQRDVARVAVLWFMLAFGLFSAMVTKFHHYIFPAVPAAAVMVGLLLDRMLGDARPGKHPYLASGTLGLGALSFAVGVASFVGSARGAIPRGANLPGPFPGMGAALVAVGLALMTISYFLWRQKPADTLSGTTPADHRGSFLTLWFGPDAPDRSERAKTLASDDSRYASVSFGAMALGALAVSLFVARDLAYHGQTRPPGYQRLLQLFTYQYERLWPTESFDYHPIMVGFMALVALSGLALAVSPLRRWGVRAMVATGFVFAAWALDVYMVDVSRHWSQRTLFERYYALRHNRAPGESHVGEDARYTADPAAAYQMNWKGENFYTGGRCAMLDCGDLPFCSNHIRPWMEQHRGQTVYIVTERTHGANVISHVRNFGGTARELTTAWDQNKFVLVRAELPAAGAR